MYSVDNPRTLAAWRQSYAHDRILASRLGAAAIDAIMEGQRNVMIGIEHDEVVYVPFTKAIKNDKPIKKDLVNVLRELSI